MRRSILAAAISVHACLAMTGVAQASRADQIIERIENANRWRDHVMIVAHRGGWKENGEVRWAENSKAGVRHAIALGVEMVELDVRTSKDGHYVVMHDTWLDRTTTCRGEVAARTLVELKSCHLVVEGSRDVTDEVVPTMEEMLALARGSVVVNIDNKVGPQHIPAILALARGMGMERSVIVKENIWSMERLAAIKDEVDAAGPGFRFMPIIADDAVEDARFIETVAGNFSANMIEMVAWRGDRRRLEADAGPLFRARVRAAAIRGNWHIWVNTYPIVNKPSGFLARGRGDELAVQASVPDEVYGYWAEHGATVIQTDEPKAAIEWLEQNGYRVPYDLTN
ncbi:glycerophosphodiester phosphodiesterase family protein [Pseudaminobacter sp. 19-2017]|uniref:Glycerophosphodiester phosphodiesterase family protein n=1 Tax=Pseudaminobacter soli (ex Zhang et al. 2022) TaxID=2831468 RepID=A0A942I3K4_9HYPH|nr:glycerophosphodiester phosphodiesterase family protein [Pseudaminobacter soli]MBS3651422.1 glycerophosphodiester phosphodiesterase family protein [Pseudaminobacter soli]